ncbi:hypothetical protein TNCV_752351 [Trichonephila clavipes]|uniref:Uncharacterized protein n=1 Tax=Trichonephila clavipes TaxID=2585209 RepID=A0A8X6WAH1_TRICX|nr:hypothetical protein TNCV_752351 [Trichonephila clavipes]
MSQHSRQYGALATEDEMESCEFCGRPCTSEAASNCLFTAELDDRRSELIVEPSVRVLVSLKTRRAERLMHVKSVEIQNPHIGVVWKFGVWDLSSDVVLVT